MPDEQIGAISPHLIAEGSIEEKEEYFLGKANNNDSEAQYIIGLLYTKKIDDPRSKNGVEYLTKAASQSYAPAQYHLGKLNIIGKFVPKNQTLGLQLIQQAANRNYEKALLYMARIYETGTLVKQDFDQAVVFYQKAAANKSGSAENALGSFYEKGVHGFKKSVDDAIIHYRNAVEYGHVIAKFNLSSLLKERGEDAESLELLKQAADGGVPQAQYNLSLTLDKENDRDLYIDCLRKAADQGLDRACYRYGMILLEGNYVEKDEDLALKYLKTAADNGHSQSLLQCAIMFKDKDPVKCRKYLESSKLPQSEKVLEEMMREANDENDPEQCYLKFLYHHRIEKDDNKAFESLRRASELQHRDAMLRYASENESGRITVVNFVEANRCYQILSDRNDDVALNNLGRNYELGYGFDPNIKKAEELYRRSYELGNIIGGLNYARVLRIKKNPDMSKSAKILASLVKKTNDPAVLCAYGRALYFGQGVDKNLRTAAHYIRMAAEAGYPNALHNYGVMLYYGEGVPQDIDLALEYFKKSAELQKPEFAFSLAQCLKSGFHTEKNENRAEELIRLAHEAGFVPASVEYAQMLIKKEQKAEAVSILDYVTKLENYDPTFKEVIGESFFHYGLMFKSGWEGQEPDLEKAKTMLQNSYFYGYQEAEKEINNIA